jgi:MinD superfamily P-loop ATPase
MPACKLVAVVNSKGGVGKSTIAVHFAEAEKGKNVALIDSGRTQEREIYARLDTASPSSDREAHLKLTRLIAASLTCGFLEGD